MGDVLGGPDLSQVLEYSAHTVLQPPDPSRAFRKHSVAVSVLLLPKGRGRGRREGGGWDPGLASQLGTRTSKCLFLASRGSQGSESNVLGQFLKVPCPWAGSWWYVALGGC